VPQVKVDLHIQPKVRRRSECLGELKSHLGRDAGAPSSESLQELLEQRWTPVGVTLPDEPFAPEVMARLIRMTGGNFRLLTRLLTQIERVLEVNELHIVSTEAVEAARESLVIGQG